MSLLGRSLMAMCVSLLFATGRLAAEPTQLRWKLAPGGELIYRFTQDFALKANAGGAAFDVSAKTRMDCRVATRSVADDGNAAVEVTVKSMRIDFRSPMGLGFLGPFVFDSMKPEENSGEALERMRPTLEAIVGYPIPLTVTPSGETGEIKLPETISKALAAQPRIGQAGGVFSEDGLKQLLSQMFLRLPSEPIEPGHSWHLKLHRRAPPLGRLSIDARHEFAGLAREEEREIARITISLDATFDPDRAVAGANVVELTEKRDTGLALFDPVAGHTLRTELDHEFHLDVEVNEVPFTQEIRIGQKLERVAE